MIWKEHFFYCFCFRIFLPVILVPLVREQIKDSPIKGFAVSAANSFDYVTKLTMVGVTNVRGDVLNKCENNQSSVFWLYEFIHFIAKAIETESVKIRQNSSCLDF